MVAYYVVITLQYILWLYSIFIVIDAIMSWLPFLANSILGRLLDKIVDPYLNLFRQGPIRKLAFATGIDVSAVIGLFILYFIQSYALNWLFNILYKILG